MLFALVVLIATSVIVPLTVSFFNVLSVYGGTEDCDEEGIQRLPRVCELLFGRLTRRMLANAAAPRIRERYPPAPHVSCSSSTLKDLTTCALDTGNDGSTSGSRSLSPCSDSDRYQ